MNTIRANCPQRACLHSFEVPVKTVGQIVRCPRCRRPFQVILQGSAMAAHRDDAVSAKISQHSGQSASEPLKLPTRSVPSESRPNKVSAKTTSVPKDQATAPPPPPPRRTNSLPTKDIGKRWGRFEIRRELGTGSFGRVYYAYDPVLAREVALKVPHPQTVATPQASQRFLREAQAAAQLRHPHIVPVFDAGSERQEYYIASAYVPGRSLAEVIQQQGPFVFGKAAAIVRQLASALHYAHQQGIVHRDIKPHNVMLDEQGSPHIMDFGLAKVAGSQEQLTHDGTIMGTPAYMPPEQADRKSTADVGPAADQYSLGALFYELLTGRAPFEGPVPVVIYNVLNAEPSPLRSYCPEVPRDLETVCQKAMSKEIRQRYADCGEMSEDLDRWEKRLPILARPIGPAERLVRWCRRNPVVAGLTALTLLLLACVAIVSAIGYARTAAALAQAETSFRKSRETVDEMLAVVADEDLKDIPGVQPLRRQLAEKALGKYIEIAAEHPKSADVQRSLGKAYSSTASIIGQIGGFEEAKTKFEIAEQKLAALVDREPDDFETRFELSQCRQELAYLYWVNQRPAQAYDWLKRVHDDTEEMLAGDADNARLQKFHAKTLNMLGNCDRETKAVDRGISWYRKSEAVYQQLVDRFPEQPDYYMGLAAPVHNIALALKNRGDFQEAQSLFERSESLDKKAIELGKASPTLESNISILLSNKAANLRQLKRFAEARAAHTESVTRVRNVADRNPNVHRYRDLLAMSLANAKRYRADDSEAEEQRVRKDLLEAISIRLDLCDRDPSNPQFAESLLDTYWTVANFERLAEKLADAQKILAQGIERGRNFEQQFPQSPEVFHALALLHSEQAEIALKENDDSRALTRFDRCLEIYETYVLGHESHLEREAYLHSYINISGQAVDACRRLKDESRAQKYIQRVLPRTATVRRTDTIDTLARLYNIRGDWLRDEAKDLENAIESWKQCLSITEPAFEKTPWNWWLRSRLSGAYMDLAKAYEQQQDWTREVQAHREWLRIWGGPMQSMKTSGYVDNKRPATKSEAERLRKHVATSPGMKKFTVPCDFNGVKAPFDVYITETPPDVDPLADQAKWLWEVRGGKIPEDVRESFRKLRAIAAKNKVSFQDLCVYALNKAHEEKQNDPKQPKKK